MRRNVCHGIVGGTPRRHEDVGSRADLVHDRLRLGPQEPYSRGLVCRLPAFGHRRRVLGRDHALHGLGYQIHRAGARSGNRLDATGAGTFCVVKDVAIGTPSPGSAANTPVESAKTTPPQSAELSRKSRRLSTCESMLRLLKVLVRSHSRLNWGSRLVPYCAVARFSMRNIAWASAAESAGSLASEAAVAA